MVESPWVSDNTLTTGQSFTLRAIVRNRGTARAAATTLRYYRSANSTIATSDRSVGTDAVSGLAAPGTSAESIRLNAPSSAGTYYYGACVNTVSGESNTDNNCSTGVRVTVSSGGGGGGGSSSPDLVVESPSVSDNTLTTRQSFTLRATVRNRGTARAAATTLRYYRSANSTIATSDRSVGTDAVRGLSASATSPETISLNAPSSAGTYYYGACVNTVSGESNTDNNCSTGVRVTVGSDDHSNTRSGATSLSVGSSRSGRLETGGDVDYFSVRVSRSGTLTVYTTGSTDTRGALQNSSGSNLATDDDGGSGNNFSITRSVSAGTYYIQVRGYSSSTTGSYTVHARSGGGGGGGDSNDITGIITECSGTLISSSRASVTVGGTLSARRDVSELRAIASANGIEVGTQYIGTLRAGRSAPFSISGTITVSGTSLRCGVRMEWRTGSSAKLTAGVPASSDSEQVDVQGRLSLSPALLHRKRSGD